MDGALNDAELNDFQVSFPFSTLLHFFMDKLNITTNNKNY
jgi:hypothetical protein